MTQVLEVTESKSGECQLCRPLGRMPDVKGAWHAQAAVCLHQLTMDVSVQQLGCCDGGALFVWGVTQQDISPLEAGQHTTSVGLPTSHVCAGVSRVSAEQLAKDEAFDMVLLEHELARESNQPARHLHLHASGMCWIL